MTGTEKNKNTHFEFSDYDTYQWYLDAGPNSALDDKYLHGTVAAWNSAMAHPDYDEFWKRQAWMRQLHSSPVPNLNVAGFWDQEDPWGPWQIFAHSAESDPDHNNYMVAGPWFHGQWQKPNAEASQDTATAGMTPRENSGTISRRLSSAIFFMVKGSAPPGG